MALGYVMKGRETRRYRTELKGMTLLVTGQDWKLQNMTERDETGSNKTGLEGTGQDWKGQDCGVCGRGIYLDRGGDI